ncbi:aspartate/glutamate racemase family protein [Egicoccus sp. AB-alg6-2]|uniref:aspartate/glutamate racemase family protein n=1 Tax=Egicoccus sp. AB-alg6-2 TaxID=3242692 RepID=UPI00359CF7F5
MAPTIALVHTVPALAEHFEALLAQRLPDAHLHHAVHEQLLQRTISDGHLSEATAHELAEVVGDVGAGADLVLVTCSTLGPAVDALAGGDGPRVVRVDEAMGREALRLGGRIGVLATLTSTLEPTVGLLERLAAEEGQDVEVVAQLCEGAFEAVREGDGERHDELVRAGLDRLLDHDVEVVVLAQASMARVLDTLDEPPSVPVLSSPELAADHVASVVAGS